MNLENIASQQLDIAKSATDVSGLNSLQEAANSGDVAKLEKAAEQFEAIFVRMMLKSMRQAQDVLADENNPMNSQYMKFYRDMHDQEIAKDLSANEGLGLADLIVKQLGPVQEGYTPASILRNDGNLPSIEQSSAKKTAGFKDEQAFVDALEPIIQPIADNLGIEPKALLAQAALETGWGQHMIHDQAGNNSHNLFGIKADNSWQGEKVSVSTLEYQDGIAKKQTASFKMYDSVESSIADYAQFLEKDRYQQAVSVVHQPQQFFSELQKAGYASDPIYAEKVVGIMNRLSE